MLSVSAALSLLACLATIHLLAAAGAPAHIAGWVAGEHLRRVVAGLVATPQVADDAHVGHLEDFPPLARLGAHLDEGQFPVQRGHLREIDDLDHVDKLVQLLDHLLGASAGQFDLFRETV